MKKHVYIYSPSGAVRDKAGFRRAVRRLEAMGLEVEVDEDALAAHQRFAGDDATRIAAVRRASASGADIAMISRGGYGLTRILADLPYKAVHKAVERGTQFVGLSDFTAMQCALLARTGTRTWAGPSVIEAFGGPRGKDPNPVTLACFEDMVTGRGEGTGWRRPRTRPERAGAAGRAHARWLAEDSTYAVHDATLWGGNLSMVCSLLGTPYFPAIRDGILFLEDVAEAPYRVERMLIQLLHAGVLQAQRAILLGSFTESRLVPHDRGFNLDRVIDHLRSQVRVPVLEKLPFGHGPAKVMLPVGRACDLIVEGPDVFLLWGHAHHEA